jgi:hypothetical protein
MFGVVFAMRHEPKQQPQTGSLTELASVHGLGTQVQRLKQATQQLRRERDELLAVLTQLAELLERVGDDHRRVAQLGEHGPYKAGVASSILAPPTTTQRVDLELEHLDQRPSQRDVRNLMPELHGQHPPRLLDLAHRDTSGP